MVFFPVTHAGIHERGLVEYYRDLAASTDLGLMLFHRGDDRLTNGVIADLADVDNVVAVKWAIDDVEAFGAAVEAIPDDRLVWVDGLAELSTIPYFAEGAEGFTSGIANFVPELSLALMAVLRDGDEERAAELRSERGADNAIPGANGVSVLKYGQDLAGLYGGPLRPPSVELAAEDHERAAAYYDRIQRASW